MTTHSISAQAQTGIRLFAVWSGAAYLVLLTIGLWCFADFLPPPAPTASAADIAGLFDHNLGGIRIGMIFEMFGAAAYIPFTAIIALFVSRIEGHVGVLTISQIMGGMGNVVLTFYPAMWFLIASFRPDAAPELKRMFNDAGWLQFVGGLTIFYPVSLSIAVAALMDRSPRPVFPRWVGYFNLWLTVLLLPGLVIFFVKTGAFAWNGILAFWMPLSVFGAWFIVMIACLHKGVRAAAPL